MKLFVLLILISFSLGISSPNVSAEQKIVVEHYQQQARYVFGLKLLNLALSKLNLPYEVITPDAQELNEARGERMVISGDLDLQWMSTNVSREKTMIPIRIPIYRGVHGLRLLLVTKEKFSAISDIRTTEDLRQFVGGHGSHWGDLPVYKHNKLSVVTNTSYFSLFKQLEKGYFDYFHRGLNEIWDEQARYSSKLIIADNVMLFYQHPTYFFVSKHRPELAEQLKEGLQIALDDGSFKSLFLQEFDEVISKGKLESRKLIILNNPVIPAGTPDIDTSWWFSGIVEDK